MMHKYLLDTNVVSELRRQRPHGGVVAWLQSLDDTQLHLSAVTLGEIQAGIELTREQDPAKAQEIENWLELSNGNLVDYLPTGISTVSCVIIGKN